MRTLRAVEKVPVVNRALSELQGETRVNCTREILLSAPALMNHISDDWLLAFSESQLVEPNAEKVLMHLLVCEQCCKLANLHHEYVRITQEALEQKEGEP